MITIRHNILKEYKSESYGDSYTLDMFMKYNLDAYKYGESHGLTRIIECNYEKYYIISEMPYYKPLLKNIQMFDIHRFIELICYMEKNKIFHNDFAFRNIGIDKNGVYKLIDLSSLINDDPEHHEESNYRVSYDSITNTIYIHNNCYMMSDLKEILNNINLDGTQIVFDDYFSESEIRLKN